MADKEVEKIEDDEADEDIEQLMDDFDIDKDTAKSVSELIEEGLDEDEAVELAEEL